MICHPRSLAGCSTSLFCSNNLHYATTATANDVLRYDTTMAPREITNIERFYKARYDEGMELLDDDSENAERYVTLRTTLRSTTSSSPPVNSNVFPCTHLRGVLCLTRPGIPHALATSSTSSSLRQENSPLPPRGCLAPLRSPLIHVAIAFANSLFPCSWPVERSTRDEE